MIVRPGSHLGQNWDKFVLITKKSVKFLSSIDHAKCDLLVSTQTKTCLQRQIFKGAVVLPRSTTFCEQQTKNVILVMNLSINSANLQCSLLSLFLAAFQLNWNSVSRVIMNPVFSVFWNPDLDQMNRNEEQERRERYKPGQLFWRRHQNDLT